MKVALVGPVYPYRGGIAHHTTMLARALAENHQVQTISFRRQYPRWLYPGRSDRDPSLQPLRVQAEYTLDPFYPWTWWQTAARISRFNPDVVVIQWWTTFWSLAFASLTHLMRRKGYRVLFLIHNVMPHEQRFLDAWLAKLALRPGSAFITQTERERARLLSLLPNAAVEVCDMPLFDLFSNGRVTKTEARQRLALPKSVPIALFFGIVRPYKGLKYLLEAAAQLRQKGELIYVVVAGEFWEDKAKYICQLEQLGLVGCVRFEDHYIPNEAVGLFFSAADVFVAPYVGGTQSGAVKIALDFDMPIVMSNNGSQELTTFDPYLQVVPPADAHALAMAISRALRCREIGLSSIGPHTARKAGARWNTLVSAIEKAVVRT